MDRGKIETQVRIKNGHTYVAKNIRGTEVWTWIPPKKKLPEGVVIVRGIS